LLCGSETTSGCAALRTGQAEKQTISSFSKLQTLREQLKATLPSSLTLDDLHRKKLKEFLTPVFTTLACPVDIDELVKLVADVCGLQDKTILADTEEESPGTLSELLPDSRADIAQEFERRAYLQKLWSEICELPERQRAALLLNLKDAQGGSGLALFPLTGTASFQQLAQALSRSAEELARLWNDLPLDDLQIAESLKLTRQQVINLRKSARERLSRRLKDY
jgi:hypothetical protein